MSQQINEKYLTYWDIFLKDITLFFLQKLNRTVVYLKLFIF